MSEQLWCVYVCFEQDKVSYMAHLPSEEQQRGYHEDRLYRIHWPETSIFDFKVFTNADSPDAAKSKVRQLLIDYVQPLPAASAIGAAAAAGTGRV